MSEKPPRPMAPKPASGPQRRPGLAPGPGGGALGGAKLGPQRGVPGGIKRGNESAGPGGAPFSQVDPQGSGVRPPFWKRKYLVYPKFQLTLIFLNSAVTFIMFSFVAFQVVRSHVYLENLVRSTRLPAQNLFTQMLSMQLRNLLINLAIALVLSIGVTGFSTLILSNRVAGPVVRLRNFFKSISSNGEFPASVNFRKGDFFEDLPPLINQAFTAVKKKWHR